MKVVLTGCQGFVGRHVALDLKQRGADVLGIGAKPRGDEAPRYRAWPLQGGKHLVPAEWDNEPITWIHLAWRKNLDFAAQAEQVGVMAAMLGMLVERNLQLIVAMGSAEEYGRRSGPLRESEVSQDHLSAYGWAKTAARTMLENWTRVSGVPVVWLRPFIIYGPGQQGDMALPYAVRQIRAGQLAQLSPGEQLRDFVHVADVVDFVSAIVQRTWRGFHVFNVGTGTPVALRDLLTYAAEMLQGSALLRFGARPYRDGEPMVQYADMSHAAGALGWAAKMDWRQGMRQWLGQLRRAG